MKKLPLGRPLMWPCLVVFRHGAVAHPATYIKYEVLNGFLAHTQVVASQYDQQDNGKPFQGGPALRVCTDVVWCDVVWCSVLVGM